MRKIWIAFLMMALCLFAQGSEKNCKEVGGAVLTNFLLHPSRVRKALRWAPPPVISEGGLGSTCSASKPDRSAPQSTTSSTIG